MGDSCPGGGVSMVRRRIGGNLNNPQSLILRDNSPNGEIFLIRVEHSLIGLFEICVPICIACIHDTRDSMHPRLEPGAPSSLGPRLGFEFLY